MKLLLVAVALAALLFAFVLADDARIVVFSFAFFLSFFPFLLSLSPPLHSSLFSLCTIRKVLALAFGFLLTLFHNSAPTRRTIPTLRSPPSTSSPTHQSSCVLLLWLFFFLFFLLHVADMSFFVFLRTQGVCFSSNLSTCCSALVSFFLFVNTTTVPTSLCPSRALLCELSLFVFRNVASPQRMACSSHFFFSFSFNSCSKSMAARFTCQVCVVVAFSFVACSSKKKMC